MKNIAQLYKKIMEVQNEVGTMVKDSKAKAGAYTYQYFDINQILEQMQPILYKYKLSVVQPLTNVEGKPAIKTIVIDTETGEGHKDIFVMPEKSKAQEMGSTITYYRRYCLQSLFALQAEDDDGKKGSQDKPKTKPEFTAKSLEGFKQKMGDYTKEEAKKVIKENYNISDVMMTKVLSLYRM